MRYVRMLLLHFEEALEYRSRNFVWFLIALINPLIYFAYWHGALSEKSSATSFMRLPDIASYYFLLIIAGAFLVVHIEEDVAYWDIQQGGLSRHLIKPFSYYWLKFLEEIPWRIVQGVLGVFAFLLLMMLFGQFILLTTNLYILIAAGVSIVFAYLLSFTYKMVLGISTLWFTDYSGLQQLSTVLFLIFAGFVIPIEFLPDTLQSIANILPFAYIIYYPVRAMQGVIDITDLFRIMSIQGIWLCGLLMLYRILWRFGIRKFTGVGQ